MPTGELGDTAILLSRGIEAADCMSSTSQVCPAQIILPGQTKRPQHYQTISNIEFDIILLLQIKWCAVYIDPDIVSMSRLKKCL
jgi:hypothetical protein